MTFKPGDKVNYVPSHLLDDYGIEDMEPGVVTSVNDKYVFVRFHMKEKGIFTDKFRFTSIACNPENLFPRT